MAIKGSFGIFTSTLTFVVVSKPFVFYIFSSVACFGSSFFIPKSSFTFDSLGIDFVATFYSALRVGTIKISLPCFLSAATSFSTLLTYGYLTILTTFGSTFSILVGKASGCLLGAVDFCPGSIIVK